MQIYNFGKKDPRDTLGGSCKDKGYDPNKPYQVDGITVSQPVLSSKNAPSRCDYPDDTGESNPKFGFDNDWFVCLHQERGEGQSVRDVAYIRRKNTKAGQVGGIGAMNSQRCVRSEWTMFHCVGDEGNGCRDRTVAEYICDGIWSGDNTTAEN